MNKTFLNKVLIGTLSLATLSHAKADCQTIPIADDKEVQLDEVEVTSGIVPMTLLQSAKIVTIITRGDIQRAAATNINDLLKQVAGIDVRQRGGFGVQADISINGGTFDQVMILLNGISLSNPQTGHNAADFPIDPDYIERIEILEGAAARVYGHSAFNGIINIVTRNQQPSNIQLAAQGGSFGTFGGNAGVRLKRPNISHLLCGGYQQSDGGTPKSDFKKRKTYYQGHWENAFAALEWQAGITSNDFGANTFYSAKFNNQYEETRRYIASASTKINIPDTRLTLSPSIYWHRDYDHYQLTRGMTGATAGENYHRNDVYGISINANYTWKWGKTAIGADTRRELLISTAHGEPMDEKQWKNIKNTERQYQKRGERTNNNFFFEHHFILNRLTISTGLLANHNTGQDTPLNFYPGIDVGFRPNRHWKLCLSWNKSLRMPTYTDLYISNAIQQGDRNLHPERTTMFKIGTQFRQKSIETTLNAFYSKGTDMIDWVYETETASQYHALNIGKLDNMGFSVDVLWKPTVASNKHFSITSLKLSYAFIHQHHETDQKIFKSLYALEYLRHKFTAQIDHRILSRLSASWNFRWQQRMNGFRPYAKIDGKIIWTTQQYNIWLQADNLTHHPYYDIGGVRQPGIWVMVGGTYRLKL